MENINSISLFVILSSESSKRIEGSILKSIFLFLLFAKKRTLFCFLAFFICHFSFSQFNIIPQPVEINYSKAHNVVIDSSFSIKYYSFDLADEAELLSDYFEKFHSLKIPAIFIFQDEDTLISSNQNWIILDKNGIYNEKPDGYYELNVLPDNIQINGNDAGIFYGIQTLMQMTFNNLNLQSCMITDYPRFQWRGMHLDVSRHFFGVDFIKKYIDLLAMYKMNVFHWHLTDDQGWRIEIKKYPKLTEIGAWRNGSMIGHYNEQKFDTIRYGGFYSQEEIKEVVAYAKTKHITIVPEIEMPGHALAALSAYPQYSCTGGPFEVGKAWGVYDDVFCAGNDSTFIFIQNILDEVVDLFPGEYIHIGGDECPKTRWEKCEKCQRKMKNEKLNNEHELQSYFIQRIEKYLNTKGKKIIGWDEILEGGLAPNAAVMSWRGTEGGIAAAKEKHFVVMTPGSHCYFDHYQGNPRFEPLAIGGNTTLEKVYSYEPIPDGLTEEESKYILGAQGNVWTEYMGTENQIEYMVLPRILALSEVLWSVKNKNEFSYFKKRIQSNLSILSKLDYNFKFLDTQTDFKIKISENGIVILANLDTTLSKASYGLGEIRNLNVKPNSIPYNSSGIKITSPCQFWWKVESFDTINKYIETTSFPIYISKSTSKKITFSTPPSKYYNNDADFTLVNGIKGFYPKINSEWLAWQGEDVEMIIDLREKQKISKVEIGTLLERQSWIYPPTAMIVEVSNDGNKFTHIETMKFSDINFSPPFSRSAEFKSTKTRFVKIIMKKPGIIPEGNPGAGEPSWMFFDEITID
jgi:hexosaminidase